MPTPSFIDDDEISPGDRRRRPSWWRRALAALLRSLGRTPQPGQYRDLRPRRLGGAGRGGDEI
jgi:hypothetical protein